MYTFAKTCFVFVLSSPPFPAMICFLQAASVLPTSFTFL